MRRLGALFGIVLAASFGPGLLGAAANAQPAPNGTISGRLGFEGGPYPGGFHPTAGLVEFVGPVIAGVVKVPKSGAFTIHVLAGRYTLTGCSGTRDMQCGSPQHVTVMAGATKHVRVVWLLAP